MTRITGKALLLAALAATPVCAQDATKNSILQNKADQQDVRQHTTVLAEQIQSLINELTDNGIAGDDIKVLTTTKAVLNNLSAQEMQRVLASLQQAGDNAGTKTGEQNLVDAYGAQKGIVLQFKQILKEYEQRQAADILPAKFKDLTDRQTQVMWNTAQVATDSAGKSQQELNTMQQTTAQIVQTDQNALVNDVATARQMLDKAAQNATGDQGRAMQQAQKDIDDGKLQAALDKANDDLAKGHLLQATTEQKAARDMLRQVSKDLNPPTTTVDALTDSAATLNKIIEEQKDLLLQTSAAVDAKPRPTGLDAKQGIIVDKTNSLQQDLQALNPSAADLIKDAITPMQVARAALRPYGQLPRAASSEQDAIDKLQQAAQDMSKQVADAQKAADDAAKDSTQKLQQLQQQIQQAQQAQKQVAQNTSQAAAANNANAQQQAQQQQQQVQQATQTMQQTASPLSLPASQALANAQQAMQQAQQAQQANNAQQAQQAQQQAQQDLQQANQAVQQAIAQNQQQATDPNQLAQAANQLQQAQSDVSKALADSQQQQQQQQGQQAQQQAASQQNAQQQANAQQAAQQQAASQQASSQQQAASQQSAQSMQQAQQALAQAAQATQAAAATQGLPDAAQGAVKDAQQDIAQGQQAAKQGDAQGTAKAAAAAQASLAQAQAAVAVAQAGMTPSPSMAGGPPKPPGSQPGKPGDTPTPPGPDQPSMDGAKTVSGGSTDKGSLHDTTGNGKFITVMSRERTAISETQAEPRPQEYSPMIDQYLKNLSDQATAASAR